MQITLWSIVAMSQCAIQGQKGFYATRSILGLLEVCILRKIYLYWTHKLMDF
jgi:hypothetical protein